MRPLRFLLTVFTSVVGFLLIIYIGPWRSSSQRDAEARNTVGTYFNWRTPSSLFPPSAIISLTDDNSTFFLARPAAFGPSLPIRSLSGQLWIGSGFGEDHLGRGGSGAGAEGELGCSDVPGWNDGDYHATGGSVGKKYVDTQSATADRNMGSSSSSRKRSTGAGEDVKESKGFKIPSEDDGTDDYLHHPLPASDGLKTNGNPMGSTKKPAHADIQSLQESAEIAGNIVLLSRGGCGFLEKAKWVQRRGGIALIVGDDVRGGPLVTMYARGDTSNVTIPSLFTSHTTAHLLSSLIPAGHRSGDFAFVEKLGLTAGDFADGSKANKQKATMVEKPNFTSTTAASRPTSTPKTKTHKQSQDSPTPEEEAETSQSHPGWFWSLFDGGAGANSRADSRRPPNSGNIGWVLQEDFEDDAPKPKMLKQDTPSGFETYSSDQASHGGSDDFVIGVQDWRDPDLVAQQREQQHLKTASASSSSVVHRSSQAPNALKGGSITPGSGEYGRTGHSVHEQHGLQKTKARTSTSTKDSTDKHENSSSWFSRLFHGKGHSNVKVEDTSKKIRSKDQSAAAAPPKVQTYPFLGPHEGGPPLHEGLWVTLTPTSVSSSPFFDTLLVLVISPLVTLTIVYALLLLRSRIRRRRWRAPKSIVERLPVRTYQTMPSTSASSTTSSISSPITSTTPLLPPVSRPINTRSRPRARTASDVPQGGSSLRSSTLASPTLDQIEEKRTSGLAEWRRRYGGKQRECVVCLEDYVDGVSRVMSLPCGHEFHAECITPWLTTRRRTCPICKGDVVRSMTRPSAAAGSTSSSFPLTSRQQQRQRLSSHGTEQSDNSGDEEDHEHRGRNDSGMMESDAIQEQAATSVNDDPLAALPVSREDEAFEDLERGMGLGIDRNR